MLLSCVAPLPDLSDHLIVDGQTYSYPTLAAAAAGWTTRLQSLGLARGDRVALALPNTPAFIAAYFGAQLAGAAVVLVNPQYRHAELSHLLADSEPAIVVATDENEALLREAMPATPPRLIKPDTTVFGAPPADFTACTPPDPAEMALIAYTSGTTGRAKGAVHTHASLAANCDAIITAWRWTDRDRLLLMLPLFHVHGLGVGVHGTIRSGASLELHPRFDAEVALQRLADPAITLFLACRRCMCDWLKRRASTVRRRITRGSLSRGQPRSARKPLPILPRSLASLSSNGTA